MDLKCNLSCINVSQINLFVVNLSKQGLYFLFRRQSYKFPYEYWGEWTKAKNIFENLENQFLTNTFKTFRAVY